MPVLFISHGAPSLLIDRDPTTDFFRGLGRRIPRPESILCISAHWETSAPVVTASSQPDTIHDFYGFQDELYECTYPCPGSAELAEKACSLLTNNNIDCTLNEYRGLDHGVWVPLKLMFPDADIPVVQLSLQRRKGTDYHYKTGQALQSLSNQGVLILGSGSATHNIHDFGRFELNAPPQKYVLEFDKWLCRSIEENDLDSILNYRMLAPGGIENHPTEEHLMPLFIARGAAGEGSAGKQIHQAYTYSTLSMAAYQWDRRKIIQ